MTEWQWPDEELWPTFVAAYLIEHGWIRADDAPESALPMIEVEERPEPCVLRAVIQSGVDERYVRLIEGYGFTMSDEMRARLSYVLDYAGPDFYPAGLLEEVRTQCPVLLISDEGDDEGTAALADMSAREASRALLTFPRIAATLVHHSRNALPLPFSYPVLAHLLYENPDTSPLILSAWRALPGFMLERALRNGVNGVALLTDQLKTAELEGQAGNLVRAAVDAEMRRRRAAA